MGNTYSIDHLFNQRVTDFKELFTILVKWYQVSTDKGFIKLTSLDPPTLHHLFLIASANVLPLELHIAQNSDERSYIRLLVPLAPSSSYLYFKLLQTSLSVFRLPLKKTWIPSHPLWFTISRTNYVNDINLNDNLYYKWTSIYKSLSDPTPFASLDVELITVIDSVWGRGDYLLTAIENCFERSSQPISVSNPHYLPVSYDIYGSYPSAPQYNA